jgi:S1-C subfamily serine protease
VPNHSAAYQTGLRTDDVIQKINDRPAKTTAAFLRLLKRVPAGKKGRLLIVRNQQPLEISVSLPKAR